MNRRWGRTAREGRFGLVLLTLCLACPSAPAQDVGLEETERQFREVLKRAGEIASAQQRQLVALPEGETRTLKAVVMAVEGRCQWRPAPEAPWQNAQTDDLLEPAAEIRTALGGSVALRIGHNASLLAGQGFRATIPAVMQDGGTLRTTIQLTRGRADFKVDHVGMTNDFSIVTPSTTLAVRGSAVRVQYGGLKGTETFASPNNDLDAIEVRYFLSKLTAMLSGGARSTDDIQDPVLAALFESIAPPGLVSAFLQALIDESSGVDPDDLLARVLGLDYEQFTEIVDSSDIFLCPPQAPVGNGRTAFAQQGEASPCTICTQLIFIVNVWAGSLLVEGIFELQDFPALLESFDTLRTFCPPDPFQFGGFFQEIDRFCRDHTSDPARCVELFNQAAGLPTTH